MRARGAAAREESLRALYDGHAPVLLAYALRLTDGDRNRAEDIVQETLLRAWRNLDRMDENAGPVRPWLFTVAQRLAIDAHRARRARPPEVGEAALASVPELDQVEGAEHVGAEEGGSPVAGHVVTPRSASASFSARSA